MNAQTTTARDALPSARTRKRKWGPRLIWVVPVVAALVATDLVYQRVRASGPTLRIQFRDATGLRPGQTPLQYLGVNIGKVTAVHLSEDQHHATVEVELQRSAARVAREHSTFWIVRPALDSGDLSGLGTLITGPYIEVLPGDGKSAEEFVGVPTSPLLIDPEGLPIVLLTSQGGSLHAGIPIYYRGIEVGAVRDTQLKTNATMVEVHCVIRRRFAGLIRENSKFWNVTGLDLRVGLFSGAKVDVESLKSLLIGGIAFATPDAGNPGPVREGTAFRLYDKPEEEWLEWRPEIQVFPNETEPEETEARQTRDLSLPTPKLQ